MNIYGKNESNNYYRSSKKINIIDNVGEREEMKEKKDYMNIIIDRENCKKI